MKESNLNDEIKNNNISSTNSEVDDNKVKQENEIKQETISNDNFSQNLQSKENKNIKNTEDLNIIKNKNQEKEQQENSFDKNNFQNQNNSNASEILQNHINSDDNQNQDKKVIILEKTNKKRKFIKEISYVALGAILIGIFSGASYRYIDGVMNKNDMPSPNKSYFIESNQVQKVNINREGIQTVPELYNDIKNSIVAISSQSLLSDFFYGQVAVPTSGTGVVFNINKDSVLIVTNEHVVGIGDDDTLLVAFEDEKEVPASVVGKDKDTDLAVIKVKKEDLSDEVLKGLKSIVFANSNDIKIGEFVMAIGNPLGYKKTATFGIVSGLDRHTELTGDKLSLIQTDASINSGNSGGALVNMQGEVIGINAQKIKSASADGIAFSIPSNTVKNVIKQLIEKGYVSKPQLGIYGIGVDAEIASKYKLPEGVYIKDVIRNTGAYKAGIKKEDIITNINGQIIKTMSDITSIIDKSEVGDELEITLIRENVGKMKLNVVLGEKLQKSEKDEIKQTPQIKNNRGSIQPEDLFKLFGF